MLPIDLAHNKKTNLNQPNLKPIAILPVSLCLFLSVFISLKVHAQTTQSFDTPGSYTFTAPAGVTSITVEAWGAGGGGSSITNFGGGGGGGGGAYASSVIPVTPGTSYNIVVGAGGNANSLGGYSEFRNSSSTLVKAAG